MLHATAHMLSPGQQSYTWLSFLRDLNCRAVVNQICKCSLGVVAELTAGRSLNSVVRVMFLLYDNILCSCCLEQESGFSSHDDASSCAAIAEYFLLDQSFATASTVCWLSMTLVCSLQMPAFCIEVEYSAYFESGQQNRELI